MLYFAGKEILEKGWIEYYLVCLNNECQTLFAFSFLGAYYLFQQCLTWYLKQLNDNIILLYQGIIYEEEKQNCFLY